MRVVKTANAVLDARPQNLGTTMRKATATSLFGRRAAQFSGAVLAVLLGATPSPAAGNKRDEVTGYLCVTSSCDALRLSGNSCICTKDNPWENRLSKLKLTCRKKEKGAWVACPVRPKFGN